ncbi:MAG TPA: sulfite exporter TauE/SafE family protein [Tissierellaceae bacterium]|nr:sulfite exporter TauE/SafE family protein [Tissierellaceae bacterium]
MILILIGFLSGIISGMGIGGGTILIPSLVMIYGMPQIQAQGVNLLVFIPVGLTAIITHIKQDNIEFKYTKKIALSGVISAIIGSILATKINPNNLRMYFGIFLLIIGIYEFLKKNK